MRRAVIILAINLLISSLSVLLVHGTGGMNSKDVLADIRINTSAAITITEPNLNATLTIKAINTNTAEIKYNISNREEINDKAYGIVWDTESKPLINNNKGIARYKEKKTDIISELTGLTPETTYYVRTYIMGAAGNFYGDEIIFTTAPANIGEEHQGGIVAYVLLPGDPGYSQYNAHGLIAAPYDQGTFEWGCYRNLIDATSTEFGSGPANTVAIVNECGDGDYAAKICNDLVINGYSDWYLPSKEELEKLYQNRNVIGGFSEGINYWTSSEFSPNHSWYQSFPGGDQYEFGKSSHLHVRAVRSF